MFLSSKYKILFYIIKKYLPSFLWQEITVLLLQLLSILITIVIPIVSMKLIDQVFIARSLSRLPYFLIAFAILLTAKIFIDFGVNRIVVSTTEIIGYRIRKDIITKLHEYHYSFLNTVSKGDVIARFFTDVALVVEVVSTIILSIIIDFFSVLGIALAMFKLKPEFFLIIILTAPLYIFISRRLKKDIHRSACDNRLSYSNTTKALQDDLIYLRAIQELNVQDFFLQKFLGSLQKLLESNLYFANKEIRASFFLQIIANLGPILAFLYSSWMTVIGVISLGTWTAVNSYVAKIYDPLKRLLNLDIGMQKILVSADRIYQLLESPYYSNLLKGRAQTNVDGVYQIAFKNVSFKANDGKSNKYVLKDCNLVINKGEVVGITGKTGIGKTTILNLILGFVIPETGDIIINNEKSVFDLKLIEWRNLIAFSHQFPVVFKNISLLENIYLLSDDRKHTHIFPEIMKFRNCELSGGEQQKINLERALNSNRELILLDEPTTSLDAKSIAILQSFIENLKSKKKKTIIFTCHKSPLLKIADKIIFISNNGKVQIFSKASNLLSLPIEFTELYGNSDDILGRDSYNE